MNRRNQKTVFFIALAVLCFVSFIAGRMGSASGAPPPSPTLDGGAHSRTIKRGGVNNRGPKLRVRAHAHDRTSSFGTAGSRHAIARMESIMRNRIPLERTAAWLQLVKSLDQDQIRDMVDYLHAQDVDHRNRPESTSYADNRLTRLPATAGTSRRPLRRVFCRGCDLSVEL